ncbi:DUF2585 domain-containing protein [Salinibacter grassmerensis]|uniref:DUF2585 domain-containing protein n=1 Tax=Salinibacter grassmerensis TaxID=3040353 RepID=UPI0021E80240|nr:DUF2585 domain-containing protein [Salinibacter grassmerensis]
MDSDQECLHWRRVGEFGIGGTAVVALVLSLLGRTLWGAGGSLMFWTGDIHGPLNSQCLADPFTLVHFTHGLVLFLSLSWAAQKRSPTTRFGAAYALEAIWEIAENTTFAIEAFRRQGMQQGYYGDSILNAVGDLVTAGIGVGVATILAARTSWKVVVGLIAMLEVLAWLWIREGVFLILGRLLLTVGKRVGG